MRFDGFLGNENAKRQLSAAFDSGRLPHAILIDGPSGSGKTMLAGLIAQAAVCEAAQGEKPCGVCRSCQNAAAGAHADISVLAGASARSFSVETIRRMRLDAYVSPNDGERKIYILEGAHTMTVQAQNALLKILEEPPAYVLFLLTCDGATRVLETVRSRCALVTLGPLTREETARALLTRRPELGRAAAEKAAGLSGGYVGRALMGLADGSFTAAFDFCRDFAPALAGSAQYRFLRLSGKLEGSAPLQEAVTALLPLLFRDALVLKNGADTGLSGLDEAAARLCRSFTQDKLFQLCETALQMRAAADRYANGTLLLTAYFAAFWEAAHGAAV